MKSAKDTKPEPAIRILKGATCHSLSNKSKLSYQVGCTDKFEVQVRIIGNSSAGAFNQDWVSMRAIESALERNPQSEPITSDILRALFRKRSANSPGFLFSVLLNEGFVRRSEEHKRSYDRVGADEFKAKVRALLEGNGAPLVDAKGKKIKSTKVAPEKKPSASKKR